MPRAPSETACCGSAAPGDHGGHGHHHHHHHHAFTEGHFDRAMAIGVSLNSVLVVAELAAGIAGGSLALVADAGHNAGDVVSLLLAWGASRLARRPPTPRYTWGLRRATILAALLNAVLLLLACAGILREAAHRLGDPVAVASPLMIGIAAAGVLVNGFSALLFLRGSHGDANIRAAFLHLVADAAVSVGVVVAGLAIAATGLAWIDPVVGMAIAAVIAVGAWGLLRESVDLALDAVPRGIDAGEIERALAGVPGVEDVHDLHVWKASTSETALSAHLVVPDASRREEALRQALAVARERFAVDHATVQIEGAEMGRACTQRPAESL